AQVSADFLEAACEARLSRSLHADNDAHGRCHANRRGAAHAQRPNRFPDLLHGPAIAILDARRQFRLIDKPDRTGDAAGPFNRAKWRLCHAETCQVRMRIASSCKSPLLASTSGRLMSRLPSQAVMRPLASSTTGRSAAKSQAWTPCSTMISPEPWATKRKP